MIDDADVAQAKLMLYGVVEAAKPHLRRRIGLRVFGYSGNAEC